MSWTEKYRPKTLNDVASQSEVVSVLKHFVGSATNIPHLLFYGPPGTGKTSAVLALARELFPPHLMPVKVLELNASDERGINVVREKIKTFAKSSTTVQSTNPNYPCPPFKLIILDEADSMTDDAQAALRRIMEKYSKITRFCLICNYVTRIIEPLASRCAKFRFKPLDMESMRHRIQWVCDSEGVSLANEDAFKTLVEATDGDMRRAITFLQSAAKVSPDGVLHAQIFHDIAGLVPTSLVESLVQAWQQKDFANVQQLLKNILNEGYAGYQLLLQIHDHLVSNDTVSNAQKSKMSMNLALMDKRLCDGSDEYLQMLHLMTCF